MRIAPHMPELTVAEVDRPWMAAADLCALAGVGDASRPGVKRLLNNLSDRGHLPFVKSGPSKTHPRHYSLAAGAMLRVFAEITEDGRTYRYADPIARAAADMLRREIAEAHDLHDLETRSEGALIAFSGIGKDGAPITVRECRGPEVPAFGSGLTMGLLDAGYLVGRIADLYAERWASDLIRRGEIERPERIEFGTDGWPVWPEEGNG